MWADLGQAAELARIVEDHGWAGRVAPSPNAGWCEAAFAGALGIRLDGPLARRAAASLAAAAAL
jgi:cobalamin biosynthesis protein CobD/CbiB